MDNLQTGRNGRRMLLNVKFIQITMSKVSTGQFFEAIKLHVHFSRYFFGSMRTAEGLIGNFKLQLKFQRICKEIL